ncbi:MAG TPA: DUF192 domain-containing protein [Acidimicrobiales bacterium]|jgi:uncharacterized membrane protein (UPF0127 family)|nr:DUF192 domain-containing protein [Acidimicrobiales bacterium]
MTESNAWLLCADRVVASLEVASTRRERRRGLLGRDGIDGALLIERCRSVHTIGMRFPIDVAFLDAGGVVVRIAALGRWRTASCRRARQVVEAEAGAFDRWGVRVGDTLEVRRGS